MRAIQQETVTFEKPAKEVFEAALGVVQHAKNASILAVHTGGRKLVVREKGKFSNPKLIQVWMEGHAGPSQLHVTVGTDPRTPKAVLDGRANKKALAGYLADVQGALDGSQPAPATPVSDRYVQKKDEVPWSDPGQDPDIELGRGFLAAYGVV